MTERLPHRYTGNLGFVLPGHQEASPSSSRTHQPVRAVMNATPQCMLARYSLYWLGDNNVLKPERLKHVWLSVRV